MHVNMHPNSIVYYGLLFQDVEYLVLDKRNEELLGEKNPDSVFFLGKLI